MHFNVIAPNLLLLVFPLPWNGKPLFQVITMIMISSFLKLKLSFGKKKVFLQMLIGEIYGKIFFFWAKLYFPALYPSLRILVGQLIIAWLFMGKLMMMMMMIIIAWLYGKVVDDGEDYCNCLAYGKGAHYLFETLQLSFGRFLWHLWKYLFAECWIIVHNFTIFLQS